MAKKKSEKQKRSRPGNLVEDAARRLRDGIRTGRYLAGAPLREAELVLELGMSRVPVREALHRLEGEGLVVIRPNHGAAVAGIEPHEVAEIAELCRLLEGHLLARALPALRTADLDAAEAYLEPLDTLEDRAEWSRINWRFHTQLYRAAGRPLTLELLTALRTRAENAMQLLIAGREERLQLNREHRDLLARLRAGDGPGALARLDAHLLRAKDTVLELADPEGTPRQRAQPD